MNSHFLHVDGTPCCFELVEDVIRCEVDVLQLILAARMQLHREVFDVVFESGSADLRRLGVNSPHKRLDDQKQAAGGCANQSDDDHQKYANFHSGHYSLPHPNGPSGSP